MFRVVSYCSENSNESSSCLLPSFPRRSLTRAFKKEKLRAFVSMSHIDRRENDVVLHTKRCMYDLMVVDRSCGTHTRTRQTKFNDKRTPTTQQHDTSEYAAYSSSRAAPGVLKHTTVERLVSCLTCPRRTPPRASACLSCSAIRFSSSRRALSLSLCCCLSSTSFTST